MAHNDEWMASLKIQAEADMKSVDIALESINKQIEAKSASLKKNKIGLDSGNTIYKDLVDRDIKELDRLEQKRAKLESQKVAITERYNRQVLQNEQNLTKQLDKENSKRKTSVEKAAQQELKSVQQKNAERLKQIESLYAKKQELEKKLSKYGSVLSDDDTKELQRQINKINGTIGGLSSGIKNSGDTAAKARLATIKESIANEKVLNDITARGDAATIANNEKIKQQERDKKTLEQQTTQSRNQAYNEALKLAREEFQLQKQIQDLESKKKLSNSDQQKLQGLKAQLAEVQKLKKYNMDMISSDKTRIKNINDTTSRYQRQLQYLKTMNNELDEQNTKTKSINSNIGDGVKNILKYMLAYKAIGLIEQGMRKAYDTIKDLDKAFTDIQMVTGQTKEEISELSEEYNQLAKEMGSTTQEVAEGASEWLRQGKTTEETTQLLKSSMTLSKVGAIESSEATQLLTSTLNGYKLEAQDAMNVVDKISSIDLEAATSSEELAVALSRTANSANDAGVSFDKLLAMIGTTSSVTRKSASTIGESFKTIFARMSNVAAGKDIDDEGESLNDVETTLNKMGIALRKNQKEWRNFEDVLEEVAGKWKNFSSTQQSQIATAIAGVRQQENLRALLNNWDEVGRLTGVAANSTGSATERMGIYLDSIEAKTNKLKAAWEGFITSLGQSEGFKNFIDWLTKVLEKLEHVDWQMVGMVATIGLITTAVLKLLPALKTLFATIKAGGVIAGISSGGIVPLLGLIATGIITIATAWNSASNSAEAHLEEIKENKAALEEEESNAKSLIKTYNELMSKKNVYGLTADEKQKLVDVSTDLVKNYGLEYDGIDSLTGAYVIATGAVQDYIAALEEEKNHYSQEEQETRRESIDERLNKLGYKDMEFAVANSARNMGKDFDTDLYYSYVKERESIISDIKKQMSGYFSDSISDVTKNTILEQISSNAKLLNATEIKEKYTDEYLTKLNKFGEDYNNVIKDISEEEQKYASIIEKNGVLSLDQVNKYKTALENKMAIYKEMVNKGLLTEQEYNNQVAQMEMEVNSRLDFAFKAISDKLGKNNAKFNEAANSVLNFTSELKSGKKSIQDYVKSVSDLAQSLNLKEVFGDNTEASLQFFSSLSTQLTNVLNLIKTGYESGTYKSNNDYINDIIAWGQSVQAIGNKMSTISGGNKNNKSENSVATENTDRIAKVVKDDVTSYIMERSTYDKKQNFQNTLSQVKQVWDGFVNGQEANYELLQQLTGKIELRGQEGYDYWLDTATKHKNEGLGYGITYDDFINYLETDSQLDKDVINKFKELYNEEKNLKTDVEKTELWNNEVNKYNEGNTNIIENDPAKISEYENKVQSLTETLKGYKDRVQEIDDIAKKQREKHPNKTYKNNGNTLAEVAEKEELQKKISSTEKELNEYQKKLDDAKSGEKGFEEAVADANAEIEEQKKETTDASSDIAKYINNLKDLQDSITALEKINAGELVEGTDEFNTALTTIISDVQSQMKGLNGEISQDIKDIFGQESVLYTGTMGEIVQAYYDGEITLEQLQQAISVETKNNINGIKNAIGDFLIGIGKQFDNFEVSLKITMNTGNIADKIKNAIAGVTGQDMNVGEIKIKSDAISNTLSTLGNAIKSTDLNFDLNYTPKENPLGSKDKGPTDSGNPKYTPSGSGGKSSKDKEKEEAEKLKEKIKDFRNEEGTNLEDVTEELIKQYETEERKLKLKRKNLDYANDLLDSEEETTKWLKVQEKLLKNQRKQIQENYRQNSKLEQQYSKIKKENKGYNIDSWFDEDGEATLAYKNLLNSFAQEEKDYRKSVKLDSEEDIEKAKEHIEQIKKKREYVENLFDSAQKLKQAWIENNEEIQDLFVEMNDSLKEMRDTLLDKFMNQLEREVEKTNQAYQDNIDKLDALITVQERYNDVINNAKDSQAELKKELQSNKDSYQYLDDYMRSIIFNEDDYNTLSKELDDIMSQADTLAEDYQTKINNLTEDEMYKVEEITNEYERQVDELEKQYELKKAELDVVKAQTKLENAKNERTVRMFVNGSWQWVADPDAIKSATEEVSDAQAEKDRIEREQQQEKDIHTMEAEKDENQLKIELNEQLLEKVQQSIEDLTTETHSVEEWLEIISKDGPPMLHDVISGLDKVGDIGDLLANIGADSGLIKDASKNTTAVIKKGLKNGTLDPEIWAEKIGWIKGDNGKWYAPKDDPDYDPAGFDFGKTKPETQITTDESGVQIQNGGKKESKDNKKNTNTTKSKFPKTGSLKGVYSSLNIRSGAGMNHSVIGSIPPKGRPTILGEKGDWANVKYNGVTGWSSKKYLTYDQGGIMSGKGYALKDVIKPEAVLSPEQTKAWIKLVENLTDPALARLTKTPKAESTFNNSSSKEQIVRDEYTFQNVTIKADNFEEFIASMQGYIPINNKEW